MRFNEDIVLLDFCGIPMVGNLANGYAIGLTGEGAEVCRRLKEGDVPSDDVAAVDPALLEHLSCGGFFEAGGSDAGGELRGGEDVAGVAMTDADSATPFSVSASSGGHGAVVSAYLHVTQRCNLQCRGCYSLDEKRNRLEDAPTEDVFRAIDQLAAVGVQRLVISGGEPFLRSDLPDIVRHAKRDCGIARVDVLSNGTRITPNALARMAPFVDGVSVSFDGCSAGSEPYIRREQRFDELVEAVRSIQAAGISAHIIPTAHAKNIGELPRYVELARDLGVTMNFSLLTCEPGDADLGSLLPGDEELKELGRSLLTMGNGAPVLAMDAPIGLNLTVKRRCEAGVKTLSVDADGTVYPCHMMHRPELAMGNVFTGSLDDALSGDVAAMMRSLRVEDLEGCSDCRFEYICGGGCRARSLYATGNLRSPDSYCAMIREFYDLLGEGMARSMKAGA